MRAGHDVVGLDTCYDEAALFRGCGVGRDLAFVPTTPIDVRDVTGGRPEAFARTGFRAPLG